MSFVDVRFPVEIGKGSKGGARFNNEIAEDVSGRETRTPFWTAARWEQDVLRNIKRPEDYHEVYEFHLAMMGTLYSFRAKFWGDFKSCRVHEEFTAFDQVIGTGDGATAQFQLSKSYTKGSRTYVRDITKPVGGKNVFGVGGVLVPPAQWSLVLTTGKVNFENVSTTITNITQAVNAVVSVSSATNLDVGDTFYIDNVVGMVSANETRVTITGKSGNDLTTDLDTSGFSAYASGGTAKTLPQDDEAVTWGGEFDVHCRFEDDFMEDTYESFQGFTSQFRLLEVKE